MIERKECLISGEPLKTILTIANFPIFMGTTTNDSCSDEFQDMVFVESKYSRVLQIAKVVELQKLYPKQTTTDAIGAVWKNHHEEFAKFIYRFDPSAILEIGGAHGYLSYVYDRDFKKVVSINNKVNGASGLSWVIIEPNPSPVVNCPAEFVPGFFENENLVINPETTIIHSHVLEHINDPIEFLHSLAQKMAVGQLMISSTPLLDAWLRRGYPNAINFEHSYLLTREIVEYIYENSGFEIIEIEYFGNDHSMFVCARYSGQIEEKSIRFKQELNPCFESFADEICNFYLKKRQFAEHCNSILELNSGLNSVIFGAHIFTQTLLSVGLNISKIQCVIDNDQKKHGERLYGTNLKVHSPEILRAMNNPIVILDAGAHTQDIKNQLEQINPQTRILMSESV